MDSEDLFFPPGTVSSLSILSRAELLELVRARLVATVVWAVVTEKMRGVRELGGRPIIVSDLVSAVKNGCIVEAHENSTSSWTVTVVGMDREGEPLGVVVRYSARETEPLEFVGFFFLE